jgi:hypothetical protein
MKPTTILRLGIVILTCGGLIATWTLVSGDRVSQIVASLLFGRALWGVAAGTITMRGQEVFLEDRPYRFCVLMLIFCMLGFAIAFWRQWSL